jgi:hypothetical protein
VIQSSRRIASGCGGRSAASPAGTAGESSLFGAVSWRAWSNVFLTSCQNFLLRSSFMDQLNGLPFVHNKAHGSRRYRVVNDDTAGPCEHSGGAGEEQHSKQCKRSPQKRERQRWVLKAQRTASFQDTLPSPRVVFPKTRFERAMVGRTPWSARVPRARSDPIKSTRASAAVQGNRPTLGQRTEFSSSLPGLL